MQPRFVFAASVLFSVELANWIQIWEAPALPQFSHWLCTCSSSKYSDSFQRNFKADCYNQVEITSTNSRWTSWPKLETGGRSFLFSKYFHSSRWEYWIHETILQFRRILSLTINSKLCKVREKGRRGWVSRRETCKSGTGPRWNFSPHWGVVTGHFGSSVQIENKSWFHVHCYPAVSRFDLERAREEADEKKGRAERARQEYGVQAGFLVLYKVMVMLLVLVLNGFP